jgi:hypothetical protein
LGTVSGNITILPWHMPLSTVVEPSIVSIYDPVWYPEDFSPFIKNMIFYLSIWRWLLYVYEDTIRIAVWYAKNHIAWWSKSLIEKHHVLEQQLIALRTQADLEDINNHLDEIKQIKAEIKLYSIMND